MQLKIASLTQKLQKLSLSLKEYLYNFVIDWATFFSRFNLLSLLALNSVGDLVSELLLYSTLFSFLLINF